MKVAPESVECHSPYVVPEPVVPPANQTSPSVVVRALKRALPVAGRPVAALAVKLRPPSVEV